jgi:hypothetical protein
MPSLLKTFFIEAMNALTVKKMENLMALKCSNPRFHGTFLNVHTPNMENFDT